MKYVIHATTVDDDGGVEAGTMEHTDLRSYLAELQYVRYVESLAPEALVISTSVKP